MKFYGNKHPDLADAALKGALAGLAGGAAVFTTTKLEKQLLLSDAEQRRSEPTPKRVVDTLAEREGTQISDKQAMAGGMAAHFAYSAFWGALYGVGQSRLRLPAVAAGTAYGELIYALNYRQWGILPQLGILPAPSERSLKKNLIPVGSHAVFGVATALAFDALT